MKNRIDAIYARYSSHAQDDSTSIDVQVEQCERAAGGRLAQYIDRAKTGRATAGRAELLRMLADAEAGKIRRVFVYKFDRLGRDAETHVIARTLEEAGAELVSATEGTNQLARGIQLVVAEDYSRQLAARTRDGLVKRFEQGGFTGGVVPFGYQAINRDGHKALAINPAEADIIREVIHWYLCEAIGFKGIAKRMRARGIVSRRQNDKGKRRSLGWSYTSVRLLLTNPLLTGRQRFNARKMQLNRKSGQRVPKMKEVSEHITRHDESLRIVSDETWAQIQSRMKKRSANSPRAQRGITALTGLVYCKCGAKCHSVKSQNDKGTYRYYLCSKKMRYDECEHGGRVREEAVLALIKDSFSFLAKHQDRIIERALEVATEAAKANRADANRIKGQLAEVEQEQATLIERLMDKAIPASAKEALGRKLAEVEERRNMLLAGIDGLREQATTDLEGLAECIRESIKEAREALGSGTTPERFNRIVDKYFGPMEIQADGTLRQKQLPPANAEGNLQSYIAGACFETLQSKAEQAVQSAIWAHRMAA